MFYETTPEQKVIEQLGSRQAVTVETLVELTGEETVDVRRCLARLLRKQCVEVLRPMGRGGQAVPRFYRLMRESDCEFQWDIRLFDETRVLSTSGPTSPGSLWELRCLERYA